MARYLIVFLFLLSNSAFAADQREVRLRMRKAYAAFTSLQKYLVSEERFSAADNEAEIRNLISDLQGTFHSDGLAESPYKNEPGFKSTLHILNDLLDDAQNRFVEGNKGYSLWRLRTASNYCVTCHTRLEVSYDFSGTDLGDTDLNTFELGEFYLATRQFQRAGEQFMKAATDPEFAARRLESLRKWLLVQTRVHPDPKNAIKGLVRVLNRQSLPEYQSEVLRGWLASLRRWKTEQPFKDPVVQAENLIELGVKLNDPLGGANGSVELLRASSTLHKALEKGAEVDRAKVLYLLGLAYSELPMFFVNELPELFLESCIREFPGSDDAKRAYRLYERLMTLGYTGSGGTRIPDTVRLSMKELHDLAYGIPRMEERI